jgi:hypothetical protein
MAVEQCSSRRRWRVDGNVEVMYFNCIALTSSLSSQHWLVDSTLLPLILGTHLRLRVYAQRLFVS